jgi:hypothetical protein
MAWHTAASLLLFGSLACGVAPAAPPPDAPSPSFALTAAAGDVVVTGRLADAVAAAGRAANGPLWLAWEVPAVASVRSTCCFDRAFHRTACHLEGRDQSWGSSDDQGPGTGTLLVLARWADGRDGRVRSFDSASPCDSGHVPLRRLAGVSSAQSVAFLAGLVTDAQRRVELDEALAAIAYHAGPEADAALQRLAGGEGLSGRREQALFWIGQTRGETGARFLAGVAHDDPSSEVREKAVFSLSQSDAPSAIPAIVEVARGDASAKVRGEALFWLAQSGAKDAAQVILARLDADPSAAVREKAVFAISQLEDGQAVPLLVRIARERRDPQVRKQALFWLGQSDDPRAMDFFEEVLGN